MMDKRLIGLAAIGVGIGVGIFLDRRKSGGDPSIPPPSSPGQPTVANVVVISATTAKATFSWEAVSGATYYKLNINGTMGSDNIQGTSVTINNLTPGQTYLVSVVACNSGGCSQPGPLLSVFMSAYVAPTTIPSPPGQPTASNVVVLNEISAKATFSWVAVSGATYYKLSINGTVAPEDIEDTSVTVDNLTPGKTYKVAVTACNAIGCSQPGPVLSVAVSSYSTDALNIKITTQDDYTYITWDAISGATYYIWSLYDKSPDTGASPYPGFGNSAIYQPKIQIPNTMLSQRSSWYLKVIVKPSEKSFIYSFVPQATTLTVPNAAILFKLNDPIVAQISFNQVAGAYGYDVHLFKYKYQGENMWDPNGGFTPPSYWIGYLTWLYDSNYLTVSNGKVACSIPYHMFGQDNSIIDQKHFWALIVPQYEKSYNGQRIDPFQMEFDRNMSIQPSHIPGSYFVRIWQKLIGADNFKVKLYKGGTGIANLVISKQVPQGSAFPQDIDLPTLEIGKYYYVLLCGVKAGVDGTIKQFEILAV